MPLDQQANDVAFFIQQSFSSISLCWTELWHHWPCKTIRIQLLRWSFACHFLRARWDNVAEILRKCNHIIFHKRVQICLYLNNSVSPIICALRIRFLVFDCWSNWRNYISLLPSRINLLLPWLEVNGLEHKCIFLWYIERIASNQYHLTPVNHLVVEVQFWATFNCLIYFQ